MGTQYQNYKSDFVLRESFLDITGKAVPLPTDVDFTLRYRTKHGHEYTASRQGGVYLNCAPEDDTLLVFFKAHGLCEGELHHELHLALNNAAFEDGTQNVYYLEDLHILLWDKSSSTEKLVSGLVADYTRGRAFTYGDFTPEQIEQLQRPAKEAADRYDASLANYESKASEQVERITEAATELEGLVEDFVKESTELTEKMTNATDAANAAIAAAEQRTAAAVEAAETATAEARTAKANADAATQRANSAKAAADAAAAAATDAAQETWKATEAWRSVSAAADTAAEEARGAAGDATDNAKAAGDAAKEARNAISTLEQVTNDSRSIAERAEAAATAAKAAAKAADAATEAAKTAKANADKAAAAAQQAKTDADKAIQTAIAAAQRAETATQTTEQERAILVALIEKAQHVTAGVPTGMIVGSPAAVTIGNPVKQYVRGKVLPTSALQNVLYLSDGKAVDVLPDGEIVTKEAGTSTVHVIPTDGTRFYKTIQVAAVAPCIRTAGNGIRLDKQGNIRLT